MINPDRVIGSSSSTSKGFHGVGIHFLNTSGDVRHGVTGKKSLKPQRSDDREATCFPSKSFGRIA